MAILLLLIVLPAVVWMADVHDAVMVFVGELMGMLGFAALVFAVEWLVVMVLVFEVALMFEVVLMVLLVRFVVLMAWLVVVVLVLMLEAVLLELVVPESVLGSVVAMVSVVVVQLTVLVVLMALVVTLLMALLSESHLCLSRVWSVCSAMATAKLWVLFVIAVPRGLEKLQTLIFSL